MDMPAVSTRIFRKWHRAAFVVVASLAGIVPAYATARTPPPGDYAVVRLQHHAMVYTAYAQVEPVSTVPVRALAPGALNDLHVVPGATVARGQVLGRLGGARQRAFMAGREAALRSATTREATARQVLAIAHTQYAQRLATRQDVDAARSALAAARAALDTARARLGEARAMSSLRAPAAGTVMAVQAADGEQMAVGETVLTLLPRNTLWIHATYYGADAARLRPGMHGRFQPTADSAAIPVKLVSIASALAPDGGRGAWLLPLDPASASSWIDGQSGTVTLDGPVRNGVTVPTSALVLDRGRWWVLVRTARGDRPQPVVPGPALGWRTWIANGLRAGQQVVAKDAFLKFHRDIAQSYQPPD